MYVAAVYMTQCSYLGLGIVKVAEQTLEVCVCWMMTPLLEIACR